MSHDHEAVQLAIASLDFELTPAERTRMEAGLAACPECAAIAAGHVRLQGLLQQLPVHDASPHVRQRLMRASLVPPRTRQWQVLLVAAGLVGLLLAAAVAAGAFRDRTPLDQLTDVPPTTAPALGDVVSPEPSQSGDPLASPPGPPSPPSPASGISDPTSGERLLFGAIPSGILPECVRSRTSPSGPEIEGDIAGIDCPVGAAGITEARYFLFASASQLRAWWLNGLKEMNLQPDSGGCVDGREGETVFSGGRLQCFSSSGGARLRWLDDERRIYGVVVSSTDDIRATLDWWAAAQGVSGIRADSDFTAIEQALVDEAPGGIAKDCIPYRVVGTEATQVEGSVGSIDCLVESDLVIDVGYFRFPTRSALDKWWDRRLPGLPVKEDSGGCIDGTAGETRIGQRRVACYVTDGEARIRWIDRDQLVFGALNGRIEDLPRLFRWWNDRH